MTRQDELNEAWCKYMGKCSTEIMQALAFALRWCDQHPNWISVEDELPKETNMYIVVHHNVVCTMLWYDNLKEWVDIYGITHWMDLPQPPMEISGNQRKISPNHIIGTANHIKIALDVIDKKGGEQ